MIQQQSHFPILRMRIQPWFFLTGFVTTMGDFIMFHIVLEISIPFFGLGFVCFYVF